MADGAPRERVDGVEAGGVVGRQGERGLLLRAVEVIKKKVETEKVEVRKNSRSNDHLSSLERASLSLALSLPLNRHPVPRRGGHQRPCASCRSLFVFVFQVFFFLVLSSLVPKKNSKKLKTYASGGQP